MEAVFRFHLHIPLNALSCKFYLNCTVNGIYFTHNFTFALLDLVGPITIVSCVLSWPCIRSCVTADVYSLPVSLSRFDCMIYWRFTIFHIVKAVLI